MEKEVKRGYVKWTDDDGVFHKEPLADHPELLKNASPEEQLRAEEVRRLNTAAEEQTEEQKEDADKATLETLAELKKAPDDVLTAAQLTEGEPASAAEETGSKKDSVAPSNEPVDPSHEAALRQLREETAA